MRRFPVAGTGTVGPKPSRIQVPNEPDRAVLPRAQPESPRRTRTKSGPTELCLRSQSGCLSRRAPVSRCAARRISG